MKFMPVSGHLLIEREPAESDHLIPDELRQSTPICVVTVLAIADDCIRKFYSNKNICVGKKIFVQHHAIEEIKYKDEIFSIVSENSIIGFIGDE